MNRILRRFGYQIIRVETSSTRPLFPPSRHERVEVDRILDEFVSHRTVNQHDLGNVEKWKDYLSDRRISFFEELLQELKVRQISLAKTKIVDFGSGTGYLLRLINRHESTAQLSGFDTFPEFNILAKLLCPAANFSTNFEDSGRQFDIIFCTEVLEHLIHPGAQVQKLFGSLNSGGRLILTVPNGRTDTHAAMKRRDDGAAYWGHIHYWSPESWPLFLKETLAEPAEIETGILRSGENFAIVRRADARH